MIYCLTKRPEEYVANTPNGLTGLFMIYGHDPYLFNLMSRTCNAFFMYEQGFESIPEIERTSILTHEDLWRETLECSLGGVPIRIALEELSPRKFSDFLYSNLDEELPLCRAYPPGPTARKSEGLWYTSYLRTLQHEKYYRGFLKQENNKVETVFRSRLSPDEEAFIVNQTAVLLKASEELIEKRISK